MKGTGFPSSSAMLLIFSLSFYSVVRSSRPKYNSATINYLFVVWLLRFLSDEILLPCMFCPQWTHFFQDGSKNRCCCSLFPLTGHHWCNVTLTDERGSPCGKLKITRLNHYLQTQWKHINAPTEIQTRPELHCHCTSNVCRGHIYDACLQYAPTSQLMCPSDPRHFKAAKCNQLYP